MGDFGSRFSLQLGDSKITCAMFSDSLDKLGFRNQVISLRLFGAQPGLRALGFARTVQFVPADDPDPARPYDDAIDFIDAAQPGDLIVVATGESNASAYWGELFSAAAIGRGAVGMITDGNLRDVAKVVALNFPAFSASRRPIDYRGRMQIAAAQQPVVIGGVSIAPNDLVCVDDDGVAVAPAAVAEEVMAAARARANAESTVLAELLAGATLREVWTRHGIL